LRGRRESTRCASGGGYVTKHKYAIEQPSPSCLHRSRGRREGTECPSGGGYVTKHKYAIE
jgi:hypothetical protein